MSDRLKNVAKLRNFFRNKGEKIRIFLFSETAPESYQKRDGKVHDKSVINP
jgi:hypothetical protein